MISQPVQSYIDDNDQLRPNMELLEAMTPKQLLDIIKINAGDAGLDVNKILIAVIVKMAKDANKKQ